MKYGITTNCYSVRHRQYVWCPWIFAGFGGIKIVGHFHAWSSSRVTVTNFELGFQLHAPKLSYMGLRAKLRYQWLRDIRTKRLPLWWGTDYYIIVVDRPAFDDLEHELMTMRTCNANMAKRILNDFCYAIQWDFGMFRASLGRRIRCDCGEADSRGRPVGSCMP